MEMPVGWCYLLFTDNPSESNNTIILYLFLKKRYYHWAVFGLTSYTMSSKHCVKRCKLILVVRVKLSNYCNGTICFSIKTIAGCWCKGIKASHMLYTTAWYICQSYWNTNRTLPMLMIVNIYVYGNKYSVSKKENSEVCVHLFTCHYLKLVCMSYIKAK